MYGLGAGLAISPDGKWLAFNADINASDNSQGVVSKLALVSLDANSQSSPRLIQPDPRIAIGGGAFTNAVSFTPDGKSVAYIIHDQGVDNIFVRPLDEKLLRLGLQSLDHLDLSAILAQIAT